MPLCYELTTLFSGKETSALTLNNDDQLLSPVFHLAVSSCDLTFNHPLRQVNRPRPPLLHVLKLINAPLSIALADFA